MFRCWIKGSIICSVCHPGVIMDMFQAPTLLDEPFGGSSVLQEAESGTRCPTNGNESSSVRRPFPSSTTSLISCLFPLKASPPRSPGPPLPPPSPSSRTTKRIMGKEDRRHRTLLLVGTKCSLWFSSVLLPPSLRLNQAGPA